MRASVFLLGCAACGTSEEFCPGTGPLLPPSCAGDATIDLSGPDPLFGLDGGEVVPNQLAVFRVETCDPEIEEGPYLYQIALWEIRYLGEALKDGVVYGAEIEGAKEPTTPRPLSEEDHLKLELSLVTDGKTFSSTTWELWFDLGGQVEQVAPASCPPGW